MSAWHRLMHSHFFTPMGALYYSVLMLDRKRRTNFSGFFPTSIANAGGFIIISLLLAGCATIRISSEDGDVKIVRTFGAVTLNAPPNAGAVYADLSHLGYVKSPMGQSLGLSRQSIVILSDDCRIILWVKSFSTALSLKNMLGDVGSLCFTYSGGNKEI